MLLCIVEGQLVRLRKKRLFIFFIGSSGRVSAVLIRIVYFLRIGRDLRSSHVGVLGSTLANIAGGGCLNAGGR